MSVPAFSYRVSPLLIKNNKKIQDIKDVKNYQYIQIKTYVQNSAYNINIKLKYITDKLQTFESTYVDSNFSSQHLTIVLAIQQSNF